MFKFFTEQDIKDVYATFVGNKNEEYYKTHENLYQQVQQLVPSWNSGWADYPRLATIVDLHNWIAKYNLQFDKVLSTSKNDPELTLIRYNKLDLAEYDGTNFDLHTLNLDTKDYDLVIINQTLEHVYNPFVCVKNVYDHIAPGGYFFTSVPMININHNMPFYYWGINPTGLALTCMAQGFKVLEVGFWGSQEYILNMFAYNGWPSFHSIGNTKNNVNFICQCWILCQKL